MLCIRRKLRIVEIPLHYQSRVGQSKITGDIKKAVRLGFVMIGLILKYRLKHIPTLGNRGSGRAAPRPNTAPITRGAAGHSR